MNPDENVAVDPTIEPGLRKRAAEHQVSQLLKLGALQQSPRQGLLMLTAAGLFQAGMELQESYCEAISRRPGEGAEQHLLRAQEFSSTAELMLKSHRQAERLLNLDLQFGRHSEHTAGDPDLRDPMVGASILRPQAANDSSWVDDLPDECEELPS